MTAPIGETDFSPTGEHCVEGGMARFDATAVVVVYLVLLYAIPALLVLPGLGAAGRPAGVFGLLLLLWWAVQRLVPQAAAACTVAVRWAFLGYVLAFVASMIAGLDRGLPSIEASSMDRALLTMLSSLGVVLVLIDGLRTLESVERILWWLLMLGAFGSIVGMLQFAIDFDLGSRIRIPGLVSNRESSDIATRGNTGFSRVRGLALHPIEFGVVLATLLPIGLHLSASSIRHSRLTRPATALIAAGIPLSISRSAVLALVVGLAVYSLGWTWRQRSSAALTTVVAMIAYQAVTPGLLGTLRSLFANLGSDDSVTGRTDDYGAVSGYVSERPWLGRGPGTFVVEEYRLLDNEYLRTLLEGGWIGLLALVFVLLSAGLTAAHLSRRSPLPHVRTAGRALGAAIATAMVVLATFDALAFPMYSGLLFVCIGCLGALYRITRELSAGTLGEDAP